MTHSNKFTTPTDLSEIDLCKQYESTLTIRSQHTDLDNYIGHKTHRLPSLQTGCMSLDWQTIHHTRSTASMGPSGTTSRSSSGQESPPPDQAASVILVQDTQARLWDTWTHLGSHICINAFDSIFLQSNGPKPWYGHLVGNRNRISECQDKDIRTSDGPPIQPLPLCRMYKNTQLGNLKN